MPKVSVIVPAFNSGHYIKDTLLSVLAQSYQDIEVVVVDDASTDNTAEVIRSLNSDKINYICLSENHGPSKARNIGIESARGEYIALFDSDDLMLPGRIESVILKMDEHPELGMVCTDAVKFEAFTGDYAHNHLNSKDYYRFNALKTHCVGRDFYLIEKTQANNCLFYENYILTSSVTIRKKIFDDVGYFDENLANAEDWDMWFRITQHYDLGYLDAICVRYRIREGSISTGAVHKLGINNIRVLRKRIELKLEKNLRKQACSRIAIFYAEIGYSFRCENQMQMAREYYMLSLKEKLNWIVFVQWLITFLGNDTINTLRNISAIGKIKSLVTPHRELV